MKVVIIGSGIAGLSAAWELGNQGVTDITILDRYPVASRASWAGGGILSPICPWDYPQAVQELFLESRRQYAAFFARIQQESGIDPEFRRCGLRIHRTDQEKAGRWCRRYAVTYHPEDDDSIFLPDFAQVRNPRLLQGLVQALRRRGVVFETGVAALPPQKGVPVTGVTDGRRHWPADVVVAATGAWTAHWLNESRLPTPVKGQMVLFETEKQSLGPIVIDLAEDIYLVPRRDGLVLAGSAVEPGVWDQLPDAEVIARLTAKAKKLDPSLMHAKVVAAWAGLRPYQPDGVPLIGAHPEVPRLFLHCGHYRNGINLNPASAQRLVASILGKIPADNSRD